MRGALVAVSCLPFFVAACGGSQEVDATSSSTSTASTGGSGGEGGLGGNGGAGGSSGGAGGAGGEGGSAPTTEVVHHLVVDSGSSGTRFCVFDVTRELASSRCSVGATAAICGKGKGGLAALTNGKDPAEVPGLVEPKFEEAWTALTAAWTAAGRDPAALGKLAGAAALGTGGYRDPLTAAPAANPAWDEVWKAFDAFFAKQGVAGSVSKAIPGEDEAKLAWVGVREAVAPAAAFSILETGGATLQFASGAPADAYEQLVGTSIYRGQDYSFDQSSADPAFEVCSSPADRTKQDGAKCIAYPTAKVHSNNALTELAKTVDVRPLYGLGAPWTGTFKDFPNQPPWDPKTDATLQSFSAANLAALTALACPLTDLELAAYAPSAFDVTTMSGKACYRLAFAAAYFDSVKATAKDDTILPGGDDQWARGASVTGKFFQDCK